MSAFHRPPEWQQSADRHTQLIDPVLTVRQLSRFELSLKSTVRIDHALVFATAKGGYEAYLPPRRPTRSEIAARHYTAVYEVDMGVHPFTGNAHACPATTTRSSSRPWSTCPGRSSTRPGSWAAATGTCPACSSANSSSAARPVTGGFAIADSAAAEGGACSQADQRPGPARRPGRAPGHLDPAAARATRQNIDHQRASRPSTTPRPSRSARPSGAWRSTSRWTAATGRSDALQIERAMEYGAQQQELVLQQQR